MRFPVVDPIHAVSVYYNTLALCSPLRLFFFLLIAFVLEFSINEKVKGPRVKGGA